MERTGRSHMGCFDSKYKRNHNTKRPSHGKSREQRHFAPGAHSTSTLHAPPSDLVPKKECRDGDPLEAYGGPCAIERTTQRRIAHGIAISPRPLTARCVLGCERGQDIAIGSRLTTVIGSTMPSANARRRAPAMHAKPAFGRPRGAPRPRQRP